MTTMRSRERSARRSSAGASGLAALVGALLVATGCSVGDPLGGESVDADERRPPAQSPSRDSSSPLEPVTPGPGAEADGGPAASGGGFREVFGSPVGSLRPEIGPPSTSAPPATAPPTTVPPTTAPPTTVPPTTAPPTTVPPTTAPPTTAPPETSLPPQTAPPRPPVDATANPLAASATDFVDQWNVIANELLADPELSFADVRIDPAGLVAGPGLADVGTIYAASAPNDAGRFAMSTSADGSVSAALIVGDPRVLEVVGGAIVLLVFNGDLDMMVDVIDGGLASPGSRQVVPASGGGNWVITVDETGLLTAALTVDDDPVVAETVSDLLTIDAFTLLQPTGE